MAEDDLANDLLHGANEIGTFLGISQRQTYYLLESGRLPAFKLGTKDWQARKSRLKRHVEELENGAAG